MHLIWVCLMSLGLFAQSQKAQIIQTYIYQIQAGDVSQELTKGAVQLKIKTKALSSFMNADELDGRLARQVVRFNDAYTEFGASSQAIHTYSNSLNTRLKFNFKQMIYDLEYIGGSVYRIKNAIEPIKDITECSVMLQKTLSSSFDGHKDFVINLDSQRYFGKVLAARRYLQCAKQ